MKYIVDKFHSRGHVDAWCVANCGPNVPENSEVVTEINTSICEITFAWLARFKRMTRKMNQFSFWFFDQEVVYERNMTLLSKHGGTWPMDVNPPAADGASTSESESCAEASSCGSCSDSACGPAANCATAVAHLLLG